MDLFLIAVDEFGRETSLQPLGVDAAFGTMLALHAPILADWQIFKLRFCLTLSEKEEDIP